MDQKKIILMLETIAEDFGFPEEDLSQIRGTEDGALAKAYLLCFLSGYKWEELPKEGSSSASSVMSWYTKKLAESLFESELPFRELHTIAAQTTDLIGEFEKAVSKLKKPREPGRFSFRKGGKTMPDPVVRQQTYDIILADYLNNPKFTSEAKQLIFEGWEADDPLSTIRNYAQPEFDVDFMKKVREALLKRPK